MSRWDSLYNSCKEATGKEIEDMDDASDVVDYLAEKVHKLENEMVKTYSEKEVIGLIEKLMDQIHRSDDVVFGLNYIDFKVSPLQWFNQNKKH